MANIQKSHEELIEEQRVVQQEKDRGRVLEEYDEYFFSRDYRSDSSEIREALNTTFGKPIESIRELLNALYERKGTRIQWTDRGGGLAIPMRELVDLQDKVRMINVDLFSWKPKILVQEVREGIEKALNFSLDDKTRIPKLLRGDMTTASPSEPSDLITSCESIQYLDNPLAAICNWYNQLADDGVLLVAADHPFSSFFRDIDKKFQESPIFSAFLNILRKENIPVAALAEEAYGNDRPRRYRRMMVTKVPHTALNLKSKVKDVSSTFYNEKVAYYDSADNPVEVLRSHDK